MIENAELARDILNLFADEKPWPSRLKVEDIHKAFPERSRGEIIFHVKCCKEAGLLDATINRIATTQGVTYQVGHIDGLTQKGSEFVVAARNPKIWSKAVDKCVAAGGHASLALLPDVIRSTVRKTLGLE